MWWAHLRRSLQTFGVLYADTEGRGDLEFIIVRVTVRGIKAGRADIGAALVVWRGVARCRHLRLWSIPLLPMGGSSFIVEFNISFSVAFPDVPFSCW